MNPSRILLDLLVDAYIRLLPGIIDDNVQPPTRQHRRFPGLSAQGRAAISLSETRTFADNLGLSAQQRIAAGL